MRNVKRIPVLAWTANFVLIIAIAAFAFQNLLLRKPPPKPPAAPLPLKFAAPEGGGPGDPKSLRELENPLKAPKDGPAKDSGSAILKLIGTDRVLGHPDSDSAYVVLVSRNLFLNAYVGEAIRDRSTEEEVPELAGWKLKRVTPTAAVFDTPDGEVSLKLEEVAAAPGKPGGEAKPEGAARRDGWDQMLKTYPIAIERLGTAFSHLGDEQDHGMAVGVWRNTTLNRDERWHSTNQGEWFVRAREGVYVRALQEVEGGGWITNPKERLVLTQGTWRRVNDPPR